MPPFEERRLEDAKDALRAKELLRSRSLDLLLASDVVGVSVDPELVPGRLTALAFDAVFVCRRASSLLPLPLLLLDPHIGVEKKGGLEVNPDFCIVVDTAIAIPALSHAVGGCPIF